MSLLSLKALEIAVTQIGEKEQPKGSNWGHPVQDYLFSVGINFPASWCMAFVYWCYTKAANKLLADNSAYRSGGVLTVWHKVNPLTKSFHPTIGSVFIMDLGRGLGHTGIVERFDDDNIFTIEGNSNDTGSREGFEVVRHKRSRLKIKGYINY